MSTKQGNKIIQGKSHENHKYYQRNATIQGNKSKNRKNTCQSRTSREPKTEGALEDHCNGDVGKYLVVDGGWRIGTKKTSNA